MPEGDGAPADVDLGIRLGLAIHALLGEMGDFERHDVGRLFLAARDAVEILLKLFHRLVRLEVADEDQGDVLRRVVEGVKFIGLLLGNGRDVGGPADDRPLIRVGNPHHGFIDLVELAQRRGLGAHPAFLEDDIALGVELAKDGAQETLGLHPHPKLELVRRHGDEVAREVSGGEGVHARGAAGGIDAIELVLHENLALRLDELLEFLLQLAIARRLALGLLHVLDVTPTPRGAHEHFLLADLIAELLLRVDDLEVLLVILGAERGRALEHHVLEEMRDARDAGPLVRAADMRDPSASNGRVIVPLDHEDAKTIGQRFLDDVHLLRRRDGDESGANQDEAEQTQGGVGEAKGQ